MERSDVRSSSYVMPRVPLSNWWPSSKPAGQRGKPVPERAEGRRAAFRGYDQDLLVFQEFGNLEVGL